MFKIIQDEESATYFASNSEILDFQLTNVWTGEGEN